MKMNDLETVDSATLELAIVNHNNLPGITALGRLIKEVRENDLDVLFFEESSPTWLAFPQWSDPKPISEGVVCDHLKRKTGLVSGDYAYRITAFRSLDVVAEDTSHFFTLAAAQRLVESLVWECHHLKTIGLEEGVAFNKNVFKAVLLAQQFDLKRLEEFFEKHNWVPGGVLTIPNDLQYPCLYEIELDAAKKDNLVYHLRIHDQCPLAIAKLSKLMEG